MKKTTVAILAAAALACALAGCTAQGGQSSDGGSGASEPAAESARPPAQDTQRETAPEGATSEQEGEPMQARTIEVTANEASVAFELNDSAAADALLAQLPLAVEVDDFSTNEKIFYPPHTLDAAGAPHAQGGIGTLAYYAPWGNVVMFYGDYSPNGDLYELGQATSGTDAIGSLSGTIEIKAE